MIVDDSVVVMVIVIIIIIIIISSISIMCGFGLLWYYNKILLISAFNILIRK